MFHEMIQWNAEAAFDVFLVAFARGTNVDGYRGGATAKAFGGQGRAETLG